MSIRKAGEIIMIEFTKQEIEYLQRNPEALRLAAHYHEIEATMGSPVSEDPEGLIMFHEVRKVQLIKQADIEEKLLEAGL